MNNEETILDSKYGTESTEDTKKWTVKVIKEALWVKILLTQPVVQLPV